MRAIVSEESIRGWTRARNFALGEEYVTWGAVYGGTRCGETLSARVQGSGAEAYAVTVTIEQGKPVRGHCSCPVGGRGDCKHAAAMLLTWVHEPEAFLEQDGLDVELASKGTGELRALLKRAIEAAPELRAVLEPEPILPHSALAPLHPVQVRQQADQVFRASPQRWGAEPGIAEGLSALKAFGDAFLETGDGISAATVYDALMQSILAHYIHFDDSEGVLAQVANASLGGLFAVLESSDDAVLREGLLWKILGAWKRDLEMGGFGLADDAPSKILRAASSAERARVVDWLERGWPEGEDWSARYARQAMGRWILQLKGSAMSAGERIRLCRRAGLVRELVEMFLADERVDEAVLEAKRAADHELVGLAERVLAAGHPLAAEELIRSRARKTQNLRVIRWLLARYEKAEEPGLALELAMRLFRLKPTAEVYRDIRRLAEAIEQWSRIRPALLNLLSRPHNPTLLLEIHLAEGELDEALACLEAEPEFSPGKRERRLLVASAAEKLSPTTAIDLYREQIAWLVEHRGRDHYRTACELLKRVRALHLAIGEEEAWSRYVAAFKSQYRRLRALKDELQQAGLGRASRAGAAAQIAAL